MTGNVTQRNGYSVDGEGYIHYDDVPVSFEEAEKLAGQKLDRRRSYLINHGEVRNLVTFISTCSGCDGGGCDECGYKGKRRHGHYVPLMSEKVKKIIGGK